jgi:diacylglycerol kinase family enzyme
MEYITSGPGDATEVTQQALKGRVKRVVAVGGDRTANKVLNGYFDLDEGEVFSHSAQFRQKQAQQIWVASDDPMPVEFDSEVAEMAPAHVRILPSAVRFVT